MKKNKPILLRTMFFSILALSICMLFTGCPQSIGGGNSGGSGQEVNSNDSAQTVYDEFIGAMALNAREEDVTVDAIRMTVSIINEKIKAKGFKIVDTKDGSSVPAGITEATLRSRFKLVPVDNSGGGSGEEITLNESQQPLYDTFITAMVVKAKLEEVSAETVRSELSRHNNNIQSIGFRIVDKQPDTVITQGTTAETLKNRFRPFAL